MRKGKIEVGLSKKGALIHKAVNISFLKDVFCMILYIIMLTFYILKSARRSVVVTS